MTRDPAAFAAALGGRGRLMGLDLGTRTIGVALADAGWRVATPALHIRRLRLAADLDALRLFGQRQEIAGVVLGYPLNMDDSEGPRAQATRAFARALAPLGWPVLLHDERLSTVTARDAMVAAHWTRTRREAAIDRMAAAVILEGALEALTRAAQA